MTSNQGKLLRIIPLATIAVALVTIGGPGKLSQLPAPARWSLLACVVFAFIEPVLPGRRFGGQFAVGSQALGLQRNARRFWKVLLIVYIYLLVAQVIGVGWFYGRVPLRYSLIAPAVIVVLIGVARRTLKLLQTSPETPAKSLNC